MKCGPRSCRVPATEPRGNEIRRQKSADLPPGFVLRRATLDNRLMRRADGSASDADYGVIGKAYTRFRQPDPRIPAAIHAAFGEARRIINVGAGAGSYEPTDREVTAGLLDRHTSRLGPCFVRSGSRWLLQIWAQSPLPGGFGSFARMSIGRLVCAWRSLALQWWAFCPGLSGCFSKR